MWSCIHSIPIPTDIRLPQGKSFMMFACNHIIPKKVKKVRITYLTLLECMTSVLLINSTLTYGTETSP